jgi:predicted RNase H-like nuclease (RuvC/YqgF family)
MLLNIIYISLAVIVGFGLAWVIQYNKLQRQGKELKSTKGFLESERLMKETVQKELAIVHQNKMTTELDLSQKLQAAEKIIRQMDSDILLMQKNYEDTEALLQVTQPEVHALKLQLIEAQNTIARLKAKTGGN